MRLRLIEGSVNKTVNNDKERRVKTRKSEECALHVVQFSMQNERGWEKRERERERKARRNKIEESGDVGRGGQVRVSIGWREAGRYCRRTRWRWQEEGRRRRGRRSRREMTGKSNEDASSYPRRCGTMPWSNLHQGWTSTIH